MLKLQWIAFLLLLATSLHSQPIDTAIVRRIDAKHVSLYIPTYNALVEKSKSCDIFTKESSGIIAQQDLLLDFRLKTIQDQSLMLKQVEVNLSQSVLELGTIKTQYKIEKRREKKRIIVAILVSLGTGVLTGLLIAK